MDTTETVRAARELLNHVTPLKGDCGRLCARACCRADEDGRGGMLLFPGEEALYADAEDRGFRILPDDSVIPDGRLLICGGVCSREERPLACRLFPLRPRADGSIVADRRGWDVCPLARESLRALNPDFTDACRQAAQMLCACEEEKRFLRALGVSIRRGLNETGLWEHGTGRE